MIVEITLRIQANEPTKKASIELAKEAASMVGTVISAKEAGQQISYRQNNALHLYFQQLSDALNDAGKDMKHVIKTDIQWTPYSVKENLWRPLQKARTGKESTKEVDSKEIDSIYEELNRIIGERTGVHVPFPGIGYER